MVNILVVEDDENLNKSICLFLEQKGFNIQSCFDGEQAFDLLYKKSYDLIITDIMMPNVDGFQLVENVRQLNKDIPIIIMTAKEDFLSKQKGFNAGIDDYLVKPFGVMEMVARVKAVLRRTTKVVLTDDITVGAITLKEKEHKVIIEGKKIELTHKEFEMLKLFMNNPNLVFSRDKLMSEIWGMDYIGETRTVDMHIKTLRQKLGNAGGQIKTVIGVGYRLENEV